MPGQKGNSGGKKARSGRKSKAEELGLAALLDECWTIAQRKACIRQLAANAAAGDMDAIKLLMSYAFGKPKETVDLTHAGGVEIVYVNDWRSRESS